MTTVAATLAGVVRPVFGATLPMSVRAWDGSVVPAADPTAPTVVLRSADALRRLLWAPGEIGLSRAYVTGELDVEGDLADALRRVRAAGRHGRPVRLTPATVGRALVAAVRLGAVKPPLPRPASEARPTGRKHSRRRDASVISHHYDLSNTLYTLLLDNDHIAYSCGYWTSDDPGYTVADAQRDKLDMICRKLGLRPGSRLLDVGCGWGALPLHAAKEYGARVTGVDDLTRAARVRPSAGRHRGSRALVELGCRTTRRRRRPVRRHFDDRDGRTRGRAQLPGVPSRCTACCARRADCSRSRCHAAAPPGGGPFIEPYIAPDMHMRPLQSCRRDRRRGLRDPRRPACASTTSGPWRPGDEESRADGTRWSAAWASSRRGCGGSTWWAGRLASSSTGWASTRCCRSSRPPAGRTSMPATRLGWEPLAGRGTPDDAVRMRAPGMTSFATEPFFTGMAVTFVVAVAVFVASWLVALRVGRFNVVDVVWGLSFVVIAAGVVPLVRGARRAGLAARRCHLCWWLPGSPTCRYIGGAQSREGRGSTVRGHAR